MSRDNNGRRGHNIKCDIFFKMMMKFKLFETVLKYENSIEKYFKSRLISGKVFYQSEQNFASSFPLQKYIDEDIKNYIIARYLYGCEISSFIVEGGV